MVVQDPAPAHLIHRSAGSEEVGTVPASWDWSSGHATARLGDSTQMEFLTYLPRGAYTCLGPSPKLKLWPSRWK
jgi:hypothetical protein